MRPSRIFAQLLFAASAALTYDVPEGMLLYEHPTTAQGMAAPPPNLTFTDGALRMNHMQVVGTHNSYHTETFRSNWRRILQDYFGYFFARDYFYTHADLGVQLESQHVRSLELDVFVDKRHGKHYIDPLLYDHSRRPYKSKSYDYRKPGFKVFNEADIDYWSNCVLFRDCLEKVKNWLDKHPDSVPIPILLELKMANSTIKTEPIIWWPEYLEDLDDEIIKVFGRDRVIIPDDIRVENMTLEKSVMTRGWPDLDSARGKVFFLMHNAYVESVSGLPHSVYLHNRPNLEGRALFTNSAPGQPSSAFVRASHESLFHF
jgi:hypothetical protein